MYKTNDQLWKGVIEELFENCVALLLPSVFSFIDFSKEIAFLDKELEQIYSETDDKTRLVDKLVKVSMLDGKDCWLLIHIEVQGYVDVDFSKRIYIYYVRLKEKYNMPITALAIYTDNVKNFKPNTYEEMCYGTGIRYKYQIYKILDQNITILQSSKNPFATVIETVLVALQKKKLDDNDLLSLKTDLVKRLFEKQISKQKFVL